MAIAPTTLTSGGSGSDTTVYTTASFTPTADNLVLVALGSVEKTGTGDTVTLSGNGLTYVQIRNEEVDVGVGFHCVLFRAMGSAPTAGAVTITWNNTQRRCAWSVVEFEDVDTGGSDGANAIVQDAGNSSASARLDLTITLAAFGDATNNAAYGAFTMSNQAVTPGTGFTELHEQQAGGENQKLQTEWRLGEDTSVDASWASASACVGVAVEIKAPGAGPSVGRVPLMSLLGVG